MKPASMLGIVLIVVGVLVLVFQGITYTRDRSTASIGPIEITAEEKRTIPLSPILGGIALVAGLALVFAGGRKA
jgi:hypothetical protein